MTTENTLQQLERTAIDDSPLCDNTTLNEELLHPDPYRSELARDATRWLVVLSGLRAEADGTDLLVAWNTVFDAKRIRADLAGADVRVHDAAVEVVVKLAGIHAVREVEASTEPTSPEVELAAMELYARTRAKLREMDIAAGAPVSPLN